jgi:hypothetical protein
LGKFRKERINMKDIDDRAEFGCQLDLGDERTGRKEFRSTPWILWQTY